MEVDARDGRCLKEDPVDLLLDRTLGQEGEKARFILLPTDAFLPNPVQKVRRWREERFMQVCRAAQFLEKKRQVVAFRKTRQLRRVVQAHVEQTADLDLP
jgi:hypothetical protein